MFLILIATLTAATVQGFPQLPLFQQQNPIQFLPIIEIPQRELHDFNKKSTLQNLVIYELTSRGFQSDVFGSEVSPVHRKHGTNSKLQIEPYRDLNSAFVNSELANKNTDGLTPTVPDSYSSRRVEVKPRNGFVDNGTSFNNNSRAGINHKTRLIEVSSRKVVYVPKRRFLTNENTSKVEDTVNGHIQKKNPMLVHNSTQKIIPNAITQKPKMKISSLNESESNKHSMERNRNITHSSNQNISSDTNLDRNVSNETKDSKVTGGEHEKPVNVSALNGTTADVENTMQAPVVTNVHLNTQEKPMAPSSRSGSDNIERSDDEDKWIWNVTEKVETTTPDIENRVSFDGGSCPTGKIRVAGMCVLVDKD